MMEFDANALYVLCKHTDLKAKYEMGTTECLCGGEKANRKNRRRLSSNPPPARGAVHPRRLLDVLQIPSYHTPGVGYAPKDSSSGRARKGLERITWRETYKQASVANRPTRVLLRLQLK